MVSGPQGTETAQVALVAAIAHALQHLVRERVLTGIRNHYNQMVDVRPDRLGKWRVLSTKFNLSTDEMGLVTWSARYQHPPASAQDVHNAVDAACNLM